MDSEATVKPEFGTDNSSTIWSADEANSLECWINSIKAEVLARAEALFNGLVRALENGGAGAGECVDCVADLFHGMTDEIQKKENDLRCFSRGDGVFLAIQELIKICNVHGDMILDRYFRCLDVEDLEDSVKTGRLRLEEREFDHYVPLLHEMVTLISFIEEYRRYLTRRSRAEGRGDDAFFQLDAFSVSVDRLEALYTSLEKHLLSDHVKVAMSGDTEGDTSEANAISMVGDTFDAIQASLSRASSTLTKKIFLTMLEHVSQLLSHDYMERLQKIKIPNLSTLLSNGPADAFVGLNIRDMSANYLETYVCKEWWYQYSQVFRKDLDLEKVLEELEHSAEDFRNEARAGLKQLAQAVQRGENWDKRVQSSNTSVQETSSPLDPLVVPLQPLLTNDNYNILVSFLADDLANTLIPTGAEKTLRVSNVDPSEELRSEPCSGRRFIDLSSATE